MGTVHEGGINGWALTGLGILLAEGDTTFSAQTELVRQDLKIIGAKPAETDLIITVIREYNLLMRVLEGEKSFERRFSIPTFLAVLPSIFADPYSSPKERRQAVLSADAMLKKLL